MISEICLQLFLYYPSHAIYCTLKQCFKNHARKLLNELPPNEQKYYFLFNERRNKKSCEETIKYALKNNNTQIFYKLCSKFNSSNMMRFMAKHAAKYGRKKELDFIANILARQQLFELGEIIDKINTKENTNFHDHLVSNDASYSDVNILLRIV
jgi:hypothetical protein